MQVVSVEQKQAEISAKVQSGNCHANWKPSEFFPNGRHMWFEGMNTEVQTFRDRLIHDFGFDPGADCAESGFDCPPMILDALYDNDNGYGQIGS